MDIFSPTIIDNAIITGSNNASLLQVSSPSAASAFFISGSGNVGIGTTTPSTTFQVAGTSSLQNIVFDAHNTYDIGTISTRVRNIWSNGSIVGVGGTFNNLTTYFTASIGGGASGFTPSANLHVSGASNSNLLRVSSPTQTNILFITGSGNIGVGTTTPGVTLDVVGQIRASTTMFNNTTQTNIIQLSSATNLQFLSASVETARYDNNGWGFFNTTPTAKVHISGANNEALLQVSSPSNANILFVTGSGRVGIKNSTPLYDLSVGGNINIQSSGFLDFGNGNSRVVDLGLTSGQGYPLAFHTFGPIGTGTSNNIVEKMRLTGSGSLGLGTTNPSARFHISGGFTDGNLMRIQSTTGAEYFFISASGNVGIGTSTPTNTLQVVGGITATSITSSLLGTASVSVNAQTASFLPIGTYNITSSWAQSASNAVNAQTASFLPIGTYSITSSWATNALTASNITPSITNNTDNRVLTATGGGTINGETNLTFDGSVLTVTGRADISTSITSSTATIGFGLTSALNAGQTTIRSSGVDTVGALTIQNSGGTGTFTVLNGGTTGVGENNPSARLHVKGSGATSATTALRVENSSAAARLTILDDGTSAFNTSHLYVSGSGLVGIGTATPSAQLHISGSATTPLRIQNPATTLMQISSSVANSGSIVFFGTTPTAAGLDLEIQSNGAANGGQVRIAGNGTQWDFGSVSAVARNGTGNSEMFSATMTGTSTTLVQNPVRIQFNANQSSAGGGGYTVLRLNATHASTAGTGSKLLQTWEFGGVAQSVMDISGSLGIGTGSAPSARLFISGASNQALFEIDSPAVNNIIYVSGSGNVGIGTNLPSAELHISGASADNLLRVGSPTQANTLFITGSNRVGIGTGTPRALFEVNDKIIAEAGGNVGIQTTADYWIHLSTDPGGGKYLNIDATQTSNPPAEYTPSGGSTMNKVVGNISDSNVLGTPDYWMEIKLGGTTVLIPCYTPTP